MRKALGRNANRKISELGRSRDLAIFYMSIFKSLTMSNVDSSVDTETAKSVLFLIRFEISNLFESKDMFSN